MFTKNCIYVAINFLLLAASCQPSRTQVNVCIIPTKIENRIIRYIQENRIDEQSLPSVILFKTDSYKDSTVYYIGETIFLNSIIDHLPCYDTLILNKHVLVYCNCPGMNKYNSAHYTKKYKYLVFNDNKIHLKIDSKGDVYDDQHVILYDPQLVKIISYKDSLIETNVTGIPF